MPSPSWNDIEEQAVLFARNWSSATREQADKQTFWNEFFAIFGISRRLVATFEEPVKGLRKTYKFIDLLWKGKILVEHKSSGEDLDDAARQDFDSVQDLESVRRGDKVPRYVLCSDFQQPRPLRPRTRRVRPILDSSEKISINSAYEFVVFELEREYMGYGSG